MKYVASLLALVGALIVLAVAAMPAQAYSCRGVEAIPGGVGSIITSHQTYPPWRLCR